MPTSRLSTRFAEAMPPNARLLGALLAALLLFGAGAIAATAYAASAVPPQQSSANSAPVQSTTVQTPMPVASNVYFDTDKPADSDWPQELIDLSIKLLLVIGLLLTVVWLLRRYVGGGTSSANGRHSTITVLEQKHLAPNRAIYVVNAAGKVLVIGATQGQMSLLTEVTDPKMLDFILTKRDQPSGTLPFSNYLQAFLNRTAPIALGRNAPIDRQSVLDQP